MLKATWPSLPLSSTVIGALDVAVKLYQALPIWPLQICGSPGSSVVALRSPLSEKGKLEIACASAKLSFDGGEALAGEGELKAARKSARTAAAKQDRSRRRRCRRMTTSLSDPLGSNDARLVGNAEAESKPQSGLFGWSLVAGCRWPTAVATRCGRFPFVA